MRRPSVPIGIGLLAAVLALGAVGCGKEEAPRNETRIQRASRLLNSGTVRQRQAAAAALGDMQGSESADLLLKALADPHVNVKRSAAAALLKRDDPRAALRAASLIDHNDAGLRTLAVSLAKRFPHPSLVEPLAGRLKDPQMLIRAEAADALSRIGEPAVEALIEQAGSGDPKAQREAARALGQIGKHRAAAALANLLDSPDTDVRLQAAAALGLVGDPRGVPALKRIVTDPLTDAEKQRFARRLGAAPSPLAEQRAIDRLRREKGRRALPGNSRYPHVQRNRARKLAETVEQIRLLVARPLSQDARKTLAAVLAFRMGEQKWKSLTEDRRNQLIDEEADRLAAIVSQDRESWEGSGVGQFLMERTAAMWWEGLSPEQRRQQVQRELAEPIRRRQQGRREAVQTAAVRALARIGTVAAVEAVLDVLANHRDRKVRERLRSDIRMAGNAAAAGFARYAALPGRSLKRRVEALGLAADIHGASVSEQLRPLLESPEDTLRKLAAMTIARDPSPESLPLVTELLNSPRVRKYLQVRVAAARRVADARYAEAIPELVKMLADDSDGIRFAAADALGQIGDASAVPPLMAYVRAHRDGKKPSKSVLAAIRALGDLADPAAAELLVSLADHPSGDVKEIVLAAMGKVDDPTVREALLATFRDGDERLRKAAMWALKEQGGAVVEPLVEILNGPEESLRGPAGHVLWSIGEPAVPAMRKQLRQGGKEAKLAAMRLMVDRRVRDALGDIRPLLSSDEPVVRAAGAWAVGALVDPAAVKELKRLTKDPNPKVARSAEVALWKIQRDH